MPYTKEVRELARLIGEAYSSGGKSPEVAFQGILDSGAYRLMRAGHYAQAGIAVRSELELGGRYIRGNDTDIGCALELAFVLAALKNEVEPGFLP